MTQQQKDAIICLRRDGLGYPDIAGMLNLSVNTVKSFGRRSGVVASDAPTGPSMRFCPQCGCRFLRPEGRKPKRLCSDVCRQRWWHAHRDQSASARHAVCPACGQTFAARRGQKYCSHHCYVFWRFGDGMRARKRMRSHENSVVPASPLVRSAAFLRGFSSMKTS